jgi:hypothetical protein
VKYVYRLLIIATILGMACCVANGDDVKPTAISVRPNSVNASLVTNGGFEQIGENSFPTGWSWNRNNTDASCVLDTASAAGGQRSLKFLSTTPMEAAYTALLTGSNSMKIEPGKPYTISAWAKTTDPGLASMITGSGWQYRLSLEPTDGRWEPFSLTFVPGESSREVRVYFQVESANKGILLDDLKLEAGPRATFSDIPEDLRGSVGLWPASRNMNVTTEGEFSVPFVLFVPKNISGTLEASISTSKARISQPVKLKQGIYQVDVNGLAAGANFDPRQVKLCLIEGKKETASASTNVRFYSAEYAKACLDEIDRKLAGLAGKLVLLESRGQDISYPQVSYTVLENFVGYAREDGANGETERMIEQVNDMKTMLTQLEADLDEALAGKRTFAAVPRWTGDTRPVVKGSSFIAPTTTPGKPGREIRPVFFTGYGHFGQVQSDLEKFPRYGTNIIQMETAPANVLPADGVINDTPARAVLNLLDRARSAGIAVNLLISPHYMPAWAFDKYPDLKKRREGFLQYCLHAPDGQALLKKYISAVVTPIKDHPALHSICISNEPINVEEPCEYAERDWHVWLEKRHGDIAILNAKWQTSYTSFDDVKLPNPFEPSDKKPTARRVDYIRWNQEFFATWHKMLADAVHAVAPNIPVHSKAMTYTFSEPGSVRFGVDAYLMSSLSDINGNDTMDWCNFGSGDFAQGWMTQARGYDLQRSVKDAPVFNSENHIMGDKDSRYVPASQVRSALWQGAIHGQSATTIWVWERTFDQASDFYGNIMHRPACARAVGIVNCDLNRAAREVTAIQQTPVQVQILHDTSALTLDGDGYSPCTMKLYMALSFTGVKIGFVTERQLEAGIIPTAPVMFIPNAKYLSDSAYKTLQGYKGRLVTLGADPLACNEYGTPRQTKPAADSIEYVSGKTYAGDIWMSLLSKLSAWNISPHVKLTDADGKPVWGVEYLQAETTNGTVVNMCNYLNNVESVKLSMGGKATKSTDVLTGEPVTGVIKLQPLEVRLLKIEQTGGK